MNESASKTPEILETIQEMITKTHLFQKKRK